MSLLDALLTEQENPRTADLDVLDTVAALERLNDEDTLPAKAVRAEIPRIARAVDVVVASLGAGGRLIYVGAGTSGRLGCLDAAEIPPTFGADSGLVVGLIAGGPTALQASVEGAEDDPAQGAAALAAIDLRPPDVVCGIAASGRTPFVLGALEHAREHGCGTIGIANTRPAELERLSDVFIAPLVGPEAISGSTRLKAGTAQKMALNMISTLAMVRLGKTYGNLMVDVRATNEKLRHRALRLVRRLAGVDEVEARGLLEAGGWEVKVAVVMARRGMAAPEARAALDAVGGLLRVALGEERSVDAATAPGALPTPVEISRPG